MIQTLTTYFQRNRLERILLFAQTDFKLRYYKNRLGAVWALINPLSQVAVYYLIFEVVVESGVEKFTLYLFSGLVLWMFFSEVTSTSTTILQTKRQFFENTQMGKFEVYLSLIISGLYGFLFNFSLYILVSLFYNVWPSIHWLGMIPIMLILSLFTLAVSLVLSNLFLLFKDITNIWSVALRFGFFLSPILFRGDLFLEKLPFLVFINPMVGIINGTREVLFYGRWPDWWMLGYDFGFSCLLFGLGWVMYRRLSPFLGEMV